MTHELNDHPRLDADAHQPVHEPEPTCIPSHDGTTFHYPESGMVCSTDGHGDIHYGSDHQPLIPPMSLGTANGDRVFVRDDGKYHPGTIGGSGPDMGLGELV